MGSVSGIGGAWKMPGSGYGGKVEIGVRLGNWEFPCSTGKAAGKAVAKERLGIKWLVFMSLYCPIVYDLNNIYQELVFKRESTPNELRQLSVCS